MATKVTNQAVACGIRISTRVKPAPAGLSGAIVAILSAKTPLIHNPPSPADTFLPGLKIARDLCEKSHDDDRFCIGIGDGQQAKTPRYAKLSIYDGLKVRMASVHPYFECGLRRCPRGVLLVDASSG